MTYKAVIIEDEIPARDTLKSFLEIYFPKIEVIQEIDTVEEAIDFLSKSDTDIVFLDVQLKDGKSLKIFDTIDPKKHNIIFTTAYDDFTLQAFQLKSFGYLLKPLKPSDFKEMVNRVICHLSSVKPISKKIRISLSSGLAVVESKDIIRCESESNYARIICTENKEYFVSKTLKYVQNQMISSEDFIRVHHSHLVNVNHIDLSQVKPALILMSNGDKVPVSRSKKMALFNRIKATEKK
jgi:two-component system LytT family response regulator